MNWSGRYFFNRYVPLTRTYTTTLLAVVATFAGCGPGKEPLPELVPVTGFVTIKGQAAANILVTFIPQDGGDSRGVTDSTGKFQLIFRGVAAGALIGTHQVFFEVADPADAPSNPLPIKYTSAGNAATTADVTKAGPNNFRFDLN